MSVVDVTQITPEEENSMQRVTRVVTSGSASSSLPYATQATGTEDELSKSIPSSQIDVSSTKRDTYNPGKSSNSIELASPRTPPSTSTVFHQITSDQASFQSSRSQGLHRHESALAPVDGGFGAWSFLVAAFMVETIVWGFPNAFGVLLDAYLKDPTYASQKHATSLFPLIGTLTSGIMYCSGPVTYPVMYRYTRYRRHILWLGAFICFASLFGASYTTNVTNLLLCQGVIYAIGGSMLYNPVMSYVSEWFVARRGMASGVIYAGTAAGGLILPLALPSMLDKYGLQKTLRILSIIFFVLLLLMLPFLKGRLPDTKVYGHIRRESVVNSRHWMKNRNFQFLLLANTLQGFGYFVPIIWLPTFASELNLSTASSSLAIAILNGASIVGRLSAGWLSDTLDPWLLALSSLFGTCIVTFILWGVLSHSMAGLIAFGLAYGSLASGWSSQWTGFINQIAREDPQLSTTLLGYLMFFRGLGNILSTPITTALLQPNGRHAHSNEKLGFDVGGGRFEWVIVFTGTCFAGAALIAFVGWGMDRAHSRKGT